MNRRRLVGVLIAGVGILLVGLSTVLVADSPYDSDVVSERNPFAPDRPASLNSTTAASYLVAYEETRLYNDILRSRGYTFDTHDTVRTACTAIATNRTDADEFRVRLRCEGGIDDANRLIQPSEFSYTVTYGVAGETEAQLAIEGYPYRSRNSLRPRPSTAE